MSENLNRGILERHPISVERAREHAQGMVGLVGPHTFALQRSLWWERLRNATAPEEKLSCERMITQLAIAAGLHQYERGAEIAAANKAASDQKSRERADADAIARWS